MTKYFDNIKELKEDLDDGNYSRIVLSLLQDYVTKLGNDIDAEGLDRRTAKRIVKEIQNYKDGGLNVVALKRHVVVVELLHARRNLSKQTRKQTADYLLGLKSEEKYNPKFLRDLRPLKRHFKTPGINQIYNVIDKLLTDARSNH